MASTSILRIGASATSGFKKRFLLPSRPVIITGLYQNQPIAAVNTVNKAVQTLGNLPLRINRNYRSAFLEKPAQISCTLAQYIEKILNDPSYDLMCTENPAPPELTCLFRVPRWAKGLPIAPPLSWMHVGYGCAFAPLHFDWDLRHVLLTQIFGKKRVWLLPPRRSKALWPCENFSGISLQTFPPEERTSFLRYHEGFECVLKPGETLYIPMLWWHAVEYQEPGMSFNIRFATNPHAHVLSALPPNYLLQNVVLALINEENGGLQDEEGFESILEAYYSDHPSPYKRYLKMIGLYEELYERLCTHSLRGAYFTPFFEVENSINRRRNEPVGGRYRPRLCGIQIDRKRIPPNSLASHLAKTLWKKPLGRLKRWQIDALMNCWWLFTH